MNKDKSMLGFPVWMAIGVPVLSVFLLVCQDAHSAPQDFSLDSRMSTAGGIGTGRGIFKNKAEILNASEGKLRSIPVSSGKVYRQVDELHLPNNLGRVLTGAGGKHSWA